MKVCDACQNTGEVRVGGGTTVPCPFCKPGVVKRPPTPRAP